MANCVMVAPRSPPLIVWGMDSNMVHMAMRRSRDGDVEENVVLSSFPHIQSLLGDHPLKGDGETTNKREGFTKEVGYTFQGEVTSRRAAEEHRRL